MLEEAGHQLLLLDVREADAFEACTITSAVNYPVAMLSRSVNQFPANILEAVSKGGEMTVFLRGDLK